MSPTHTLKETFKTHRLLLLFSIGNVIHTHKINSHAKRDFYNPQALVIVFHGKCDTYRGHPKTNFSLKIIKFQNCFHGSKLKL
jgi:hypothetical protein